MENGVTYYEYRYKANKWERRFYVGESELRGEAGPAGTGLFAARDFGPGEYLTV